MLRVPLEYLGAYEDSGVISVKVIVEQVTLSSVVENKERPYCDLIVSDSTQRWVHCRIWPNTLGRLHGQLPVVGDIVRLESKASICAILISGDVQVVRWKNSWQLSSTGFMQIVKLGSNMVDGPPIPSPVAKTRPTRIVVTSLKAMKQLLCGELNGFECILSLSRCSVVLDDADFLGNLKGDSMQDIKTCLMLSDEMFCPFLVTLKSDGVSVRCWLDKSLVFMGDDTLKAIKLKESIDNASVEENIYRNQLFKLLDNIRDRIYLLEEALGSVEMEISVKDAQLDENDIPLLEPTGNPRVHITELLSCNK